MKVLSINGSHRKSGNTARITSLFSRGLEVQAPDESDIEIENLFLSDYEIKPCRGCRVCFDRGEDHCPLRDDILILRDKIRGADIAVMASPVYVNDVSGTMKTLIDRLAFICHRPEFLTTAFAFIATSGASPTRHTIRTMQSAAVSWGGQLLGGAGVITGAFMAEEDIRAKYGGRIRCLAAKVWRFYRKDRIKRPGFVSIMVYTTQKNSWKGLFTKEDIGTPDYLYWEKMGMYDKNRTYFFDHEASFFVTRTAVLTGRILAKIFG